MPRDASAAQIRAAYRRLAREHHPDLNPGVELSRFRAVDEAYRRLAGGGAVRGTTGGSPWPAPGGPPCQPAERPEPAPPGERPEPAPPAGGAPPAVSVLLLVLAVVACAPGPLLFCGLLLAPVGAVLGHAVRWQARRDGRPEPALAGVGILAGWTLTAVVVTAVTVGVLISRG